MKLERVGINKSLVFIDGRGGIDKFLWLNVWDFGRKWEEFKYLYVCVFRMCVYLVLFKFIVSFNI